MAVELNHTIVYAKDAAASARFLSEIFGLPEPTAWAPFVIVEAANGVSLDYYSTDGPVTEQHYAFLVGEDEFDAILARVRERDLTIWADPMAQREGEINHDHGGRGFYFQDPDGHMLEALTHPYDTGS